ncbi:hypothetical protein [Herbiconiux sp.]|uniref:hypothetical protein n=1 Tax=Herbiconiux sp. TaxID=1871186 RepID=UPI0025BA67F1|nr:hypothetical protein [Herbiconiux sp.]
MFRTAFGTQTAADAPASRSFLSQRMAELFPERVVTSVIFFWKSSTADIVSHDIAPFRIDERVVVDLR